MTLKTLQDGQLKAAEFVQKQSGPLDYLRSKVTQYGPGQAVLLAGDTILNPEHVTLGEHAAEGALGWPKRWGAPRLQPADAALL